MRSTVPTANPPPVCEDKKKISVTYYGHCLTLNQREQLESQLEAPMTNTPPVSTAVYSSL